MVRVRAIAEVLPNEIVVDELHAIAVAFPAWISTEVHLAAVYREVGDIKPRLPTRELHIENTEAIQHDALVANVRRKVGTVLRPVVNLHGHFALEIFVVLLAKPVLGAVPCEVSHEPFLQSRLQAADERMRVSVGSTCFALASIWSTVCRPVVR